MSEQLEYKGYKGSVEYSNEDEIFYGKILNTSDLVLYEGKTLGHLKKDFRDTVNDYIRILENAKAQ